MHKRVWSHPWPFVAASVAVFLALAFFRREVLFYPPYWDSVVGLFPEAIWLRDNGFDYLKLAYAEPGYGHGGARNLFFTVYPAFQALLLKVFPPQFFLLFNHLWTFGLAALSLTLFYRLLARTNRAAVAFAGSALLFAHPLFLSQADAINYELAVLAVSLLAIDRTLSGRAMAGAGLAALAACIKPTGVIVAFALFLFQLITIGLSKSKGQSDGAPSRKDTFWPLTILIAIGAAAIGQWFLRETLYREASDTIVVFLRGSIKREVLDSPELSVLFTIAALFMVGVAWRFWHPRTGASRMAPSDLMACLFVFSFLCFYVNIIPMLPRYFFYCLPFLLYGLIRLIDQAINAPFFTAAILLILSGLVFSNRTGQFYTPITTRDGFLLERSLEYVEDMRLNLSLAKRLEDHYAGVAIITSPPYAQMLALPELGYVTRPLAAVTRSGPLRYGGLAYREAVRAAVGDTVWLYGPNCFSSHYAYNPQEDRVIETFGEGPRQITLFTNIEYEKKAIP